jgi:hypothetical protein
MKIKVQFKLKAILATALLVVTRGMVRYGGGAVPVFLKTQSFTKIFLFTHEILH